MSQPAATEPTATAQLTCGRCGSTRLRRSRARSRLEMLVRVFTPIHFHICRDCGARGWRIGAGRVPLTRSGRRHAESRRLGRAERTLRRRAYVTVLVAVLLGLALGLGLRECDAKPTPPSTMEQLD